VKNALDKTKAQQMHAPVGSPLESTDLDQLPLKEMKAESG